MVENRLDSAVKSADDRIQASKKLRKSNLSIKRSLYVIYLEARQQLSISLVVAKAHVVCVTKFFETGALLVSMVSVLALDLNSEFVQVTGINDHLLSWWGIIK